MPAAMTQFETTLINLTQQVKKRDGQLDAITQDLATMSSELQAIRLRFQEKSWVFPSKHRSDISPVTEVVSKQVLVRLNSDASVQELPFAPNPSSTSSGSSGSDSVPDAIKKRARGVSAPAVRKTLWERWDEQERPDTFQHLLLAEDGGFSGVRGLYHHYRWVSALGFIFYVFYNVGTVFLLDCRLIWFPVMAAYQLGLQSLDQMEDKFYLTSEITHRLFVEMLGCPAPQSIHILAFLELFLLFMQIFDIIFCSFRIYRTTGFKRWYHVQYILWYILPRLSVFSNMFLLRHFVPRIAVTEAFLKITDIQEASSSGGSMTRPVLKAVLWLPYLFFCLIFGFDTALMKLRVVSHYAGRDTTNMSMINVLRVVLLPVAQFLSQILGVVQLGSFVRERLFLFIFGGEDSVMSQFDIQIMETWTALLSNRMWRLCAPHEFVAVMLSFSNEDFQSLVVHEDQEAKSNTLAKDWRRPSFERRTSRVLDIPEGAFQNHRSITADV